MLLYSAHESYRRLSLVRTVFSTDIQKSNSQTQQYTAHLLCVCSVEMQKLYSVGKINRIIRLLNGSARAFTTKAFLKYAF